jgi:endonuclease/exonuclease/phosphatase family metal-dependent hydrolase
LKGVRISHADDLDQWAFLAAASGCYCTTGISLRTQRRSFGNALLTRQKVSEVRLHDISFESREPRSVIEAMIVADGRRLRIIVTHFAFAPRRAAPPGGKAIRDPRRWRRRNRGGWHAAAGRSR